MMMMPKTLATTISKIQMVLNLNNASLITEFHNYMVSSGSSQRHQNNSLKMVIAFAKYLGPNCTFYELRRPEQIIPFLDTKIKSEGEDPDRRWIATWNYYLVHIKLFLRWLHNCASKNNDESWGMSDSNWETQLVLMATAIAAANDDIAVVPLMADGIGNARLICTTTTVDFQFGKHPHRVCNRSSLKVMNALASSGVPYEL